MRSSAEIQAELDALDAPQQGIGGMRSSADIEAEIARVDAEEAKKARAAALQQLIDDTPNSTRFMIGAGKMVHDTGAGAQQLYDEYTPFGDKQRLAASRAEELATRDSDTALMSTRAGFAGNMVANAAPSLLTGGAGLLTKAPALAKLGLAMAGSGAVGVGQAALNPTVDEEERLQDMKVAGALSAAIPGLGVVGRKLIGETTPARQALVEQLKKYGAKITPHMEYRGLLDAAYDSVSHYLPIASSAAKNSRNKEAASGVGAFWKSVGVDTPPANKLEHASIVDTKTREMIAELGNEVVPMANIRRVVGSGLGGEFAEAKKWVKKRLGDRLGEGAKEISALFGARANAKSAATQLKVGEADLLMQELRNLKSTAGPVESKFIDHVLSKVDEGMAQGMDPTKYARYKSQSDNIRAISGVRDAVSEVAEGTDIRQVANLLDNMQGVNSKVAEEGFKTASAASKLTPHVNLDPWNTEQAVGGLGAGIAAVNFPMLASAVGAGAALTKGALNTGIPQFLVNSKEARKLTAAALRGAAVSGVGKESSREKALREKRSAGKLPEYLRKQQ